jgi:septal ring factor EnvC (AmiA/AmiB activator)
MKHAAAIVATFLALALVPSAAAQDPPPPPQEQLGPDERTVALLGQRAALQELEASRLRATIAQLQKDSSEARGRFAAAAVQHDELQATIDRQKMELTGLRNEVAALKAQLQELQPPSDPN